MASGTSCGVDDGAHERAGGDVEVADRLARPGPRRPAAPRGRPGRCRPCAGGCAGTRCGSSSRRSRGRGCATRDQDPGGHDEGRRGRVGRGRARPRGRARRRSRRSRWCRCGAAATPAARSRRSVWSRLGAGSVTEVVAVGQQPGEQDARLDLRAGHRQVVVDAVQARPVDGEGRKVPAGRLDHGAHGRQRPGDAVDRAAADRASPSSVKRRPSCPASQPGSSRMSVPALPTSMGPSGSVGAAQARCRAATTSSPRCSAIAPTRGPRPGSSACRPRRGTRARGRARRTSPRAGRRGG